MRIIIKFFEGDELVCKGEASDVINAEGELQRLARFYQKYREQYMEQGDENSRTVDAVVGVGDEKNKN